MSRPRRLTRTAGEVLERPRRRYLRVVVLIAVLAVLLVVVGVAVLSGAFLNLASGTPAISALLQRVPAQTTMVYDSAGHPIAELHGAVDRVVVAKLEAAGVSEGGDGRSRRPALLPRTRGRLSGHRTGGPGRPRRGARSPGRQHDHRAVRQERLPRRLRRHPHR